MRRLPFCTRWKQLPSHASGVRSNPKYVAVAEIVARQLVAFVLRLFAGGGEQVHVAANVLARLEVRLKRFRRHLTSVDVDG